MWVKVGKKGMGWETLRLGGGNQERGGNQDRLRKEDTQLAEKQRKILTPTTSNLKIECDDVGLGYLGEGGKEEGKVGVRVRERERVGLGLR